MPSVTIDAGVLAAPLVDATEDRVFEYVETLTDWQRLLEEPWVTVHMSERAAEALLEDGLYPLRGVLDRLFAERGIVEFAANDIARVADALLQTTPSFEETFGLTDVLVSDLSTEPDLLLAHSPPHVASDLERCLVLTAVLTAHCGWPASDHALILEPQLGVTAVQVEAVIEHLEHCRDDIGGVPLKPERLRATVAVHRTFRDLVSDTDESTVWRAAHTDDTAAKAVRISVYKRRVQNGQDPDWEEVPSFSFGDHFRASVTKWSGATSPNLVGRVLRAMAETIDRTNLADTHVLRTGAGGNSPQRTRNGDKAWRRDIDREHHLHYWESANGVVEFASIGPHNDFSIPY